MKTKWFQHLQDPEDRKKFRDSVENSKYVLDRLKEICYNSIQEVEKSSTEDYRKASWAFYQADKVGYVRALRDIISLLQLDPEEK
jgi:hypothetical protein